MARVKEKYSRHKAEKRFERIYETVAGDKCIYCGMPSDGEYDHQPPVYILHRFADGGLSLKKQFESNSASANWSRAVVSATWGWGPITAPTITTEEEEL